MPIAAVPRYLGKEFKDASPGMRFGMYLPIWTDRTDQEQEVRKRAEARSREGHELADMLRNQGMDATIRALCQRQHHPLPGLWDKNDFAARKAWERVVVLNKSDKEAMEALLDRQSHAFCSTASELSRLAFHAETTAPFTTGLGNEHPLENGFAFLNPYGLPYLPGSGVKGVLRQAARELARGDWGDTQGWSDAKTYPVQIDPETTVRLSMLDVMFGRETEAGDTEHVRGALSFWDVIPQIAGESLMVEIMTPHQGHYYQQKPVAGSASPHDSGQPTPISFLTVPPGSTFVFHVICDLAHLRRLASDLAENGRWKTLLQSAFEHAFAWLGFGAKTAVGYGAMARAQSSVFSQSAGPARSRWVDDKLKELCSKPGVKLDDALRGKALAESVRTIEDAALRAAAVQDIMQRWKERNWWEAPSGKSAKEAKAIYDELLKKATEP